MRRLIAALTLAAGPAFAGEDWVTPGQTGADEALRGRALIYEDGARQAFGADGGTSYTSPDGTPSRGRWGIREGRYCSLWPPSDRWTCYDLAQSADGTAVRFTADDGSATVGRYEATE